jgi:hypothetical protein
MGTVLRVAEQDHLQSSEIFNNRSKSPSSVKQAELSPN